MSGPDSTLPPPSEPPTMRDLSALAWSLDLEQDIDEAVPSAWDEPSERGRRA
jgi:hypothetical protein